MPRTGFVSFADARERFPPEIAANTRLTRRAILLGMGASCAFAGSRALAQPARKWAAVVIGVNSAAGLPVLSAAASGARDMVKWLRNEQYEVTAFVDDTGPVKAGQIFDAIDAIVGSGRYERLVVYFAGHGFVSQQSEFWLLSKAPHNPNEAISLTASAYLARYSTIPNVVFISDACRSRAVDLGTANIQGQNIFPSPGPIPGVPVNVDQFLATHIGDSAFEAPLSESVRDFHGIYTQALLSAFASPPANLVQAVDGEVVILDRDLERFLLDEVPKRASTLNITLRQIPDAIITSPDKTYLGQVSGVYPAAAPIPASPITVKDLAVKGFKSAAAGQDLQLAPDEEWAGETSGYMRTHSIVVSSGIAPDRFEGQSGFVVANSGVKSAAASEGSKVHLSGPQAPGASMVSVDVAVGQPSSVLIQFNDGSGTIVAGLDGFVGTIVIDQGTVISVNYTPSREGGRWAGDASDRRRLDQLRANAAAAARSGVFRFDTPEEASRLAAAIRVLKGVDPTLGLYAAYAYEQAGQLDQIRSVAEVMRGDLGVLLFDVAMLADREPLVAAAGRGPVAPFCPMLSKGWNYLGVARAQIPEPAANAGKHLREALWTTFEPASVALLLESGLFPARPR